MLFIKKSKNTSLPRQTASCIDPGDYRPTWHSSGPSVPPKTGTSSLPFATWTHRYILTTHKHILKRFKTVHCFMPDSHNILAAVPSACTTEWVCAFAPLQNNDYYLHIMRNNVEEFGVRSRVGRYLGRVWALHVWFSTVVDSTLEHLLYASHEEDIGVGACDGEHSLRRNQTELSVGVNEETFP